MNVKAKFRVQSVTNGNVVLEAVTADGIPEHERFHKYTPCGKIQISIDNPVALEQFKVGDFKYVTFLAEE